MHPRRIGMTVVALALLSACADANGDGQGPGGPGSAPGTTVVATGAADPAGLLGAWTLADAGADAAAEVSLEPGRLSIKQDCGELNGDWRADTGGLFVAHLYGASGCRLPADPDPDWLRHAVAFRAEGADRVLLDAAGSPVARLRSAAASAGIVAWKLDERTQRRFGPAAALPQRLTPAARTALTGRWVPAAEAGGGRAYLELLADGSWRGSDGCNGVGGRWVAGPGGTVLAVGGASTLMACAGSPVGNWFEQARRAGLDGRTLVLVDDRGEETGRLLPDQ
jgi:heat shock protein HslJ